MARIGKNENINKPEIFGAMHVNALCSRNFESKRSFFCVRLFSIFFILTSFVLVSCSNFFHFSKSNSGSPTYLVIGPENVSLGYRTINPDMDLALSKLGNITVKGTIGTVSRNIVSSASNLSALYNSLIYLPDGAGTYSFEMTGTIDTIYFYQKIENVVIEEAKANVISFDNLSPIVSSGNTTPFPDFGGMDLKIHFDTTNAAVDEVRVTVRDLSKSEDDADAIVDTKSMTYSSSGTSKTFEYKRMVYDPDTYTTARIPTGSYKVTFDFYVMKNFVDNSVSYIVNVSRGLISYFEDTVVLNDIYKITYNNNSGSDSCTVATGQQKIERYTRKSPTIVLPRIIRKNHIFCGWYDADGNLVTTVPSGTTGNLTFTARWIEMDKSKPVTVYVNPDAEFHYGNSIEYGHSNIDEAMETFFYVGGALPDVVIKIAGSLSGSQMLSDSPKTLRYYVNSIVIEGNSELVDGVPVDEINGAFANETENGVTLPITTETPVTLRNIKITGGNNTNTGDIKGGGLYIGSKAKVTLDDGVLIEGNAAAEGSGIYSDGTFNIQGSAVVQTTGTKSNDIYIASGKTLNISKELTGVAAGIITPYSYTAGTQVLSASTGVTLADAIKKFSVTSQKSEGSEILWTIDDDGKIAVQQ